MTPPEDAEKKAREIYSQWQMLRKDLSDRETLQQLIAQAFREYEQKFATVRDVVEEIRTASETANTVAISVRYRLNVFRKRLEELIEIQKQQGDDPYTVGMANGLICALSCYTGKNPEYISAKKDDGK